MEGSAALSESAGLLAGADPPLMLSGRACRTPEEMRGKLSVQFHGEEGIDAGGVTREWYQVRCSGTRTPVAIASMNSFWRPRLTEPIAKWQAISAGLLV